MILLLFVLLFALIGFGFSIWSAMGVSGMIYILLHGQISLRLVASQMVGGVNSDTLVAIPFFILAGNLMSHSGITKKLADFADFFVGDREIAWIDDAKSKPFLTTVADSLRNMLPENLDGVIGSNEGTET